MRRTRNKYFCLLGAGFSFTLHFLLNCPKNLRTAHSLENWVDGYSSVRVIGEQMLMSNVVVMFSLESRVNGACWG